MAGGEQPTDAELLLAWRGGDQKAARELIDRHFDPLYRFFGSKVPAGVEDLIQETFLACVESRDRLEDASKFRVFLLGVARRRLYRKWRNEARGAGAIDFGLTSVVDIGPGPCSLAARREEEQVVLDAMRRLPVDLQIALEMFYWEDLRGDDIAQVLEIPTGTVRSRLRRGRDMLRDLLAEQVDDEMLGRRVRELRSLGDSKSTP